MGMFKTMSTSANPMNSARSSLDSLSQKLEARRQAFMQKKEGKTEDKAETPADAQNTAKETEKKDESVKMDAAKEWGFKDTEPEVDAKTEAKAAPESEVEGEKAEEGEKATEEPKVEEPKVHKPGFRERLNTRVAEKKQSVSDNYKAKNPDKHAKLAHYFTQASDLWDETFPNNAKEAQKKIDARKAKAREAKEHEAKIKDMTEEELAELEESIPEWKRSAIVVTEKEEVKQRGLFGRMKDRVKDKVTSSDRWKDIEQSEDYDKIQKLRKEVQEFKGDVKEQAEQS